MPAVPLGPETISWLLAKAKIASGDRLRAIVSEGRAFPLRTALPTLPGVMGNHITVEARGVGGAAGGWRT